MICFGMFTMVINAQLRPLEDQYLLNALALNPAYAGSEELLSFTILKRDQWVGFEGAPSTMTFAIHAPLKNDKVALGLLIVNDQLGYYNETGVLGNYAYRIKLWQGKLSLGLAAGVYFKYNDLAKISATDGDDELLLDSDELHLVPDFSTGVYYYTDRFFTGLSLPAFVEHRYNAGSGKYEATADFKNTNYLVTLGYKFKLNDNFDFLSSTLLKFNPQSAVQMDLNLNLIYRNKFWLGTSYRTKNAMIWLLQYSINNQLKFAYAYGTTFSKLSSYQSGTHEIMIKYNFDYLMDILSPRNF